MPRYSSIILQLRWPDTVFARARRLQKQISRRYSNHFICSMPALSLLFFLVIEHAVDCFRLLLQRYVTNK